MVLWPKAATAIFTARPRTVISRAEQSFAWQKMVATLTFCGFFSAVKAVANQPADYWMAAMVIFMARQKVLGGVTEVRSLRYQKTPRLRQKNHLNLCCSKCSAAASR